MCGRATLSTPPEELAELFGLDEKPELEPRYNIAPSQGIAIIRVDSSRSTGPARSAGRRIELVRWGLVPSGASDPNVGARMINARVESLFTRSVFREAARARRCLVVVDGFYEWKGGGRIKRPFHVRRSDGRPFALAGLWDTWNTLISATIVTAPAEPPVDAIHDRMPVVLAKRHWNAWLDAEIASVEEVRALLRSDVSDLVAVAVSSAVNSPANEGIRCLEPAEQGELLG